MITCMSCTHQPVCKFKTMFNEFYSKLYDEGIEIDMIECRKFDPSSYSIQPSSSKDNLDVAANRSIIDYEKRSQLIKAAYSDAKSEKLICPNCKQPTEQVYKCVSCGKAVCDVCSIEVDTLIDGKTVLSKMCEDCWDSTKDKEPDVEISIQDRDYISNIVKKDIPEK